MPPKKQRKITRYYPTHYQRLRQAMANLPEELVEQEILQFAIPKPITRQRFRQMAIPYMAIAFIPQEEYDSWSEEAYNEYLQVFNSTPTNQLANPEQHASSFIQEKLE